MGLWGFFKPRWNLRAVLVMRNFDWVERNREDKKKKKVKKTDTSQHRSNTYSSAQGMLSPPGSLQYPSLLLLPLDAPLQSVVRSLLGALVWVLASSLLLYTWLRCDAPVVYLGSSSIFEQESSWSDPLFRYYRHSLSPGTSFHSSTMPRISFPTEDMDCWAPFHLPFIHWSSHKYSLGTLRLTETQSLGFPWWSSG